MLNQPHTDFPISNDYVLKTGPHATLISTPISPPLTQPNRLRMLRHLRRYPEIHEVFHIAAWGRVAFGALREMIRTKNRFNRQVAVCLGLKIGFCSLGNLLSQPTAQTMP